MYLSLFSKISLVLLCALLVPLLQGWARDSNPPLRIASAVIKDFREKGKSDILIYFHESADLSTSAAIANRTARLQFVYDSLRKQAQTSQAKVKAFLEERGVRYQSFYIANSLAIEGIDEEILRQLPLENSSTEILKNQKFIGVLEQKRHYQSRAQSLGILDSLRAIGADRVWNELNFRGEGIVIAGEDTGYDWRHPALIRKYRGYNGISVLHNYSWHDSIHKPLAEFQMSRCPPNSPEPCDDQGHGTHTMGTMVGEDGANTYGVAPDAKWIGCRNMDNGVGSVATYLECFEFFLAPYPFGGDPQKDGRPEFAPHIINNSWGCPGSEGCKGPEFFSAIRSLQLAGILFIASAGNYGDSCATVAYPPGSYGGEIISVGALDHRDGKIARFSSRGPSTFNQSSGPTIAAPGVEIYSAIPKGFGVSANDLYESKSGTSMAGPHVVGAAALLWNARPELIGNIRETMETLYKSADPKTSTQNCGNFPGNQIPNAVFGYGYLNIYRAITGK